MFSSYLFILLFCSYVVLNNAENDHECDVEDPFFGAQIMLSPRPLTSLSHGVVFYMQYDFHNYIPGDQVVVVMTENNHTTLIKQIPIIIRHGVDYIMSAGTTKMFLHDAMNNHLKISTEEPVTKYQAFSAYFQRGTQRSKTFHLKAHYNWMSEQKNTLSQRPLSSVIFPGTHESGSYRKRHEMVNSISLETQALSIIEQLVFGVRFLDIVYGEFDAGDFWCYSKDRPMLRMQEVIDQVKDFMDATNEIVIMNFRSRNSENNLALNSDLPNYLTTQFKGYLFPRSPRGFDTTMGEIWASGKRLIILYDYDIHGKTDIWARIPTYKRTNSDRSIIDYISRVESYSNPKIVLIGYVQPSNMCPDIPSAELSEMMKGQIFYEYNKNHNLNANIVAVDYIENSGMVDFAINWNKWRSSHCVQLHVDVAQ